jgi:chromosome partitioning protein
MRRLAVINMKGGVAKTTTALCLAVGMAARAKKGEKPILLVDGDAQAHSSLVLLEADATPPSLSEVLLDEAQAAQAIRPTRIKNLHILPATPSLASTAIRLKDETGGELRLRRALRSVERKYSAIVIDSGPAVNLVTLSIMKAVTEIVVPVDAGLFSIHGLGMLSATVQDVRRLLDHPALIIIGIALVKAHKDRQTAELESALRSAHGKLVYRTRIPYAPVVDQAHCAYRSVLEFAPKAPVSVAYSKLIGEILNGHAKRPSRRAAQADNAA